MTKPSAKGDTTTAFYKKSFGCLAGGLIGDALGTRTEGMHYEEINKEFGWVDEFEDDGTDDTIMKILLSRALVRTDGYATADDWAAEWLSDWKSIFGTKISKFFVSVLHTAHKLRDHSTPRMAALGNMPSSSSAMAIAPVGIVNACNPRQAALQAYSIASLIHVHDVGFCQDGAAAIAAAVAEAFCNDASVQSVVTAATAHIAPQSGREMLDAIAACSELAARCGDYGAFREAVYNNAEQFFRPVFCDSRETIPLTLALFSLAEGDYRRSVTYAANFGRDADTIATMVGAIAGALHGVDGIPSTWVTTATRLSAFDQERLASQLCDVALSKIDAERAAADRLARLIES